MCMRRILLAILFLSLILPLNSYSRSNRHSRALPSQISAPGEKVIIVDPRIHKFGAYTASGRLVLSGTATAGSSWCPDIKRPCRTRSGSFRIYTLGSPSCKSTKYPLPRGGAPMPYCMFFNGHQGIHGSYQVVAGNVSHGCVRVTVSNARWLRYNFVGIGTRIIIRPY
jgi:lipoprotein-anchoring transpeptidase ErfK/SrfK